MMKRVVLGLVLVVFMDVLGGSVSAAAARTGDDYLYVTDRFMISWDDIKVDEHRSGLSSKDDLNRTRVIVVDSNGGGDSLTVQGAVDMVPPFNPQRIKIFILPGIYREKVHVPKSKPHISFIGNENKVSSTVITWNNKASDRYTDGTQLGTFRSASVTVESDYFCATGITFQNTVVAVPGGHGMQAVALRVEGDRAFFYKVKVMGAQDTLLDQSGSHYFYKCHIQGTVDFIFGRAKSLFQECLLESTAEGMGAIAAHHRDSPDEDTGFSFVDCVINGTGQILLGRAWGNYSRAIYTYCNIGDIINPLGWNDWNDTARQKTAVFGEYRCHGRGANTRGRVPWSKIFSYADVKPFIDLEFISGYQWLKL